MPKNSKRKMAIYRWYLAHPKKLVHTPRGDKEAQKKWSNKRKAMYVAGAIFGS